MSWGFLQVIETVAAVVIAVADPELIPFIGKALGAAEGAEAAAAGAAAIGAGESAVNTIAAGGNVQDALRNAAISGASSAIGSAVGGAVSSELGTPDVVAGSEQITDVGPSAQTTSAALSREGANVAGQGAKGFASNFAGSQLAGQDLETSLKKGATGGATSALSEYLFPTYGDNNQPNTFSAGDKIAKGLFSSGLSNTLSGYFNPAQGGSSTSPATSSLITGSAGTTPGTQALAQALNVGGTDISPPVQLGGEGPNKTVWNRASLRVKDETGS